MVTVSPAPDKVNAAALVMLWTVALPLLMVTVIPACGMNTSSVAPGSRPFDQLAALFQSPPPAATQVLVPRGAL